MRAEGQRIQAMSKSALETLIERVSAESSVSVSRRLILKLGRHKFGEPAPEQLQQIETCTDEVTLDRWFDQAIDATSWTELFQSSSPN